MLQFFLIIVKVDNILEVSSLPGLLQGYQRINIIFGATNCGELCLVENELYHVLAQRIVERDYGPADRHGRQRC